MIERLILALLVFLRRWFSRGEDSACEGALRYVISLIGEGPTKSRMG